MRIALIGNTESHESIRIQDEALKRGHLFDLISFTRLSFHIQNGNTLISTSKGSLLDNYDVFIFRGINSDRGEAQVMARWLEKNGKIVLERKLSEGRYVMTKLPFTLCENGIDIVPTTLRWDLPEDYLKDLVYPMLIRKTTGSKGKGMMLANNKTELLKAFNSLGPKVLLQPYFKIDHDYRVIIIGDKIIGAMKKTKPEGSIISNISSGGIASLATLPDHVLEQCLKATKASRVEIAGVDVMEDNGIYHVLEVNSMPQFKGFEESTGLNIGKEIILYMEKLFYSTKDGILEREKNSLWVFAKTSKGEKKLYPCSKKRFLKYKDIREILDNTVFLDDDDQMFIGRDIQIRYITKLKEKV